MQVGDLRRNLRVPTGSNEANYNSKLISDHQIESSESDNSRLNLLEEKNLESVPVFEAEKT